MSQKMDCCSNCKGFNTVHSFGDMEKGHLFGEDSQKDHMDNRQDNIKVNRQSLDSHGSLEFDNIDFLAPYMGNRDIVDERSWIYLGSMMIAMGSCSLGFDGSINIFKVLKESVDSLRRQV